MTNQEKNNKKRNFIIVGILLILLLCVSLGSAYLSQRLQINGTTNIGKSSWNIYFANEEEQNGSVDATEVLAIDSTKTLLTFGITFTKPGEFYEFTVDTVNGGTMDAMVNRVIYNGLDEQYEKYISFSATYRDRSEIKQYDLLAANTKETIRIRVEFKDVASEEDLPPSNLELNLELQIEYIQADEKAHTREVSLESAPIIMGYSASSSYFSNAIREKVATIILDNQIQEPDNVLFSYIICNNRYKNVMAYYVENEDDSSMYDLYIQGDGALYANPNSMRAFSGYTNLVEIRGAEKLNTSLVTNMQEAFSNCPKLKLIDTTNWDMSHVTNMNATFNGCTSLENIQTLYWDMSSVQTLISTFSGCTSLMDLNTENWDLSHATVLMDTFYDCRSLTFLDTSHWNLSNLTSFVRPFYFCSRLTSLGNTGDWNLTRLETVQFLFFGCESLTSISAENWDTSHVRGFSDAFNGAPNLNIEHLSSISFASNSNVVRMFKNCHKLSGTLNLNGVISVSGLISMFEGIEHQGEEEIIINYTKENDTIVEEFMSIASSALPNVHIIKGVLIEKE